MIEETKEKAIGRDDKGRFLKGQVHTGRPKGSKDDPIKKAKKKIEIDLKAEFTRRMEESLGISGTTLKNEAEKGNIVACKEINNRALGMPKQQMEIGGVGSETIKVEVTVKSAIEKIYGEGDNGKDSS